MRYVFGDYTLDTQRYELRGARGAIPLGRQEFLVLAYLLAHADRLVTRQELFDRLWPGLTVSDAALERCIARARRALGDNGRQQRFIKTRHGLGYRFIAPVVVSPEAGLRHIKAWLSQPSPLAHPSLLAPPVGQLVAREEDSSEPGARAAGSGSPASAPSVMPTLPGINPLPCATCQHPNPSASHVGESPQLFPALFGMFCFVLVRGELSVARELAEHLLRLAQAYGQAGQHEEGLMEIAHWQQVKALELRAALSLARLWQQRGQRVEAHQWLADIYGWLTEGFDTADLQDARALLEELA